jgi:short-subunit dehydrogenase
MVVSLADGFGWSFGGLVHVNGERGGFLRECWLGQAHWRGGGYIFNISSLAGINTFPEGAAYSASKSGLNCFSEALMQEVRCEGIRVSYILPGSVATEFGFAARPKSEDSWKVAAEDVAKAIVDLCRFPERTIASRVEIRPSRPPRKKWPGRRRLE